VANYWRVSPRVWYEDWSDDARILALYLLTCEHRELEGLYRLPRGYVCEDLGWSSQRLAKPFTELLQCGFIEYDEDTCVILLRKALKYQRPENPNQVKHALAKIEGLPDTPLIAGLLDAAERFAEPFAQQLRQRFGEGYAKPPAPTTAPEETTSHPSPAPDPDDGFDDFYGAYPRKVGKTDAARRWRNLPAADRKAAQAAAGHLAKHVAGGGVDLKYVPYPGTFLGPRRVFEDWATGRPDGYGGNGTEARKTAQCGCGMDLTYDEHGLHCPVCGFRPPQGRAHE